MSFCSVSGCSNPFYSRGFCGKHYQRFRVTGTTDDGPKAQAPLAVRFWKKVEKRGPDECWPWTGSTLRAGYGKIARGAKKDGSIGAHVVSLELATGSPCPDGMVVMHSCDNPCCVNPAHLRLGTYQDNTDDMVAKGRQRVVPPPPTPVGMGHHLAVLTDDLVRQIRASRDTSAVWGEFLGVSASTIRRARSGATWKHVV